MIWCFQTIYFVLSSFIVIIFAMFDSSKRGWLTKLIGEVVDEDAIVEMDAIVEVKDDIAVEAICGFCKWITRKPLKILEQILKEWRKKWERERDLWERENWYFHYMRNLHSTQIYIVNQRIQKSWITYKYHLEKSSNNQNRISRSNSCHN